MASQTPASPSSPAPKPPRQATAKPAVAKPLPPQQQAMAAQAVEAEVLEDDDALEEEEAPGRRRSRFLLLNAVPSWLVSMVVHAVLLIVLALLSFGPDLEQVKTMLSVVPSEVEEEIEQFEMEEFEPLDVEVTEVTTPTPVAAVATEVPQEVTEVAVANDVDAAPVHVDLVDFSERTAPRNDLMAEIGSVSGSGLEGRGAAQRGQMIAKYGGTQGSEEAVARALKWLALHQLPNGAWSFDHRNALTCQGKCSGQGTLDRGFNGATAMALLPFLGAGQTHKEGKYQETVRRGLYYLLSVQKPDGSLFESGGSMYSHGLCAITLCEAYAMTQDRELMMPAQASLNFIMYAQDPVGGGWRYQPKQAGDTSVVGWQLMALKSGHMAYLQVSPNTVLGTTKFLDSVQADSGSKYGYTGPGSGTATTAVGLLCRMYLGWKKDNAALERGVEFLSATGPSKTNLYYNYYATQVMRHYEGEKWKKWNDEQRDWLVASQSREGHMDGSWLIKGDHGSDRGGRLYCTSMATMILEVYYRHLPIFRKESTTEEFPL